MRPETNERWRSIEARLGREMELWFTTIRPDDHPHIEPSWFVWLENVLYLAVGVGTQQWENLLQNQNVVAALPSTTNVLIIEGTAHAADRNVSQQLADYFYNKYEWDFMEDDSAEWRLVSVTPARILAWGDGYDETLGVRVL